jgi:hypothetical protein
MINQRVMHIARGGGDFADHLPEFLRVRARGLGPRHRGRELRVRDHLHGLGDPRDRADRGHALLDFTKCGHGGFEKGRTV